MPDPEAVDVPANPDNGNVAVDDIKPADGAAPTADPAEEPGAGNPPAGEPELFELPDGRKVDAATLANEWKTNFMPDYTRKSQDLARLSKPPTEILPDNKPTPKVYENPDWAPSSYAELIAIAKDEVKGDFQREEQARADAVKAIEDAVVGQLTEIKTADPTVNENALFLHANKYGFKDLKLAHANMKDMASVIKKTQTTTAQNIAKRNDPVSINPGASGARPDSSSFGSSIEFLRSLK